MKRRLKERSVRGGRRRVKCEQREGDLMFKNDERERKRV